VRGGRWEEGREHGVSPDVVVGENELAEHRQHFHWQAVALGQAVALRLQHTQLLRVAHESAHETTRERAKAAGGSRRRDATRT